MLSRQGNAFNGMPSIKADNKPVVPFASIRLWTLKMPQRPIATQIRASAP